MLVWLVRYLIYQITLNYSAIQNIFNLNNPNLNIKGSSVLIELGTAQQGLLIIFVHNRLFEITLLNVFPLVGLETSFVLLNNYPDFDNPYTEQINFTDF